MLSLFFRQFRALLLKNWIILAKHPILTILRCFIIPIAIAIFLAYAQLFLTKPSYGGLGTMVPVARLADIFNPSLTLVWSDDTNGASTMHPDDTFARITKDFSSKQLASVRKADTSEIGAICQKNFMGTSGCFAAVTFEPPSAAGSNVTSLNYTIRADNVMGFEYINVRDHTSDYEVRILPLQWAVESAIIELDTGVTPATPLEWPYTKFNDSDVFDSIRLTYISFVSGVLIIVFFVCFVEVSYQLPTLAVRERASGLTSHMKAMGVGDAARILSWHVSFSLVYLPGSLITAGIWHAKLWTGTSAGLLVGIHILTTLSLVSYALFAMAPFGKSPQLAAISSLMLAYVCCILGMTLSVIPTASFFVLILLFPPMFYPVAIRCITAFEVAGLPTSTTTPDPDFGLTLSPLIGAVLIGIVIWPWIGAHLERSLYDAHNPSEGWCGRRKKGDKNRAPPPSGMAISVRNLGKDFRTGWFKGKNGLVTAISDLSLDVPKHGIFVLLGPNGAGKSTAMSILGGLTGRTRGTVVFEGGVERPARGTIGLVPQKNILFPELTCYQTLQLWQAIKPKADYAEDIVQLLKDCDLGAKIYHDVGALSGGQKRKLQLAVGLIGGSKILLVDECTSGVDPLSRRAIWKTLTSVKNDRTIVFTTHFLDEADLLGDEIAVLAAPGKLVAHGSPVMLKSTLGEGYTMKVTYQADTLADSSALLGLLRGITPQVHTSTPDLNETVYHLKTHDIAVVRRVLETVEREKTRLHINSYAVFATTIEDIFLDLMQDAEQKKSGPESEQEKEEDPPSFPESLPASPAKIELSSGTHRTVFGQALTIFHKRCLVARRNWLSYVLALVVICVSTITLRYVPSNAETCEVVGTADPFGTIKLFMPDSYIGSRTDYGFPDDLPLITPPGLLSALGNVTSALNVESLPSNASFVDVVSKNYTQLYDGGISLDLQNGAALVVWDVQQALSGPIFLNTVSNLLYNKALNDTGRALAGGAPKFISPAMGTFPSISSGSLTPLIWAAFFGLAVAIYPAFFTLYVAQERRSSVQEMQFSNGLSNPVGLWLGHVMFDALFSVLAATILVIVFSVKSTLFQGLGYLWFIIVLHGFTGSLFAYVWTLFIQSPTGAFAAVMAYQLVVFGLYLAGYMLTLTYSLVTESGRIINTIHFTLALISPSFNVVRAGFVSVNLFSLLCEGSSAVPTSSLGSITRFGGPILYLILHGLILFGILVLADSGSMFKQRLLTTRSRKVAAKSTAETKDLSSDTDKSDVLAEAQAVEHSSDALRVLGVSKTFGSTGTVVDGVSFGVATDTIFALLGPNGAGKTTTFNMIRGDLTPDAGEILINGRSITRHTQTARVSLGVCPQFTAIDAQLTVREHLQVYARLKGLRRGAETARNVEGIMAMTNLSAYADRLANKLSGGNQRKLALAIALIGNPSVVLIDEFSSGVDAKMKRDMWATLKNVAVGKAIVITTHSMEEASTLANKVGIIAKRMLAVGTTDTLLSRYDRYLVHFPGRTREDIVRARELMARIPGARMANDVVTRFEVPVGDGLSLAQLFAVLADATKENGGGVGEYAVEKASLESVFMKVIRDNAVEEGDGEARRRAWWRWFV
ncbi:P-loop containing nucleoside triphosphate hydrolase protein [Daedaleopsis nitida]|nr:P-loop containing nucleoside triphosphate hydrolase protein [Daedaleopsis nitida]